ncbi:MAG: hypothetical protein KME13_22465 [Myxacorys californica WJT36-NPBG1]|nr:hypothetical protein [Myxacorys californica WJT36-NPBG1]
MPRIDGNRLEKICVGITQLSKIGGAVSPYDLLEYIPEDLEVKDARDLA